MRDDCVKKFIFASHSSKLTFFHAAVMFLGHRLCVEVIKAKFTFYGILSREVHQLSCLLKKNQVCLWKQVRTVNNLNMLRILFTFTLTDSCRTAYRADLFFVFRRKARCSTSLRRKLDLWLST